MTSQRSDRMRTYQREWCRRRRQEALAKMGPCVKCGSAENLEFDHIDPASKIDSHIWTWSEKRLRAELAKCQVLCRPCHKEKTAAEWVARYAKKHNGRCQCSRCFWKRFHERYPEQTTDPTLRLRVIAQRLRMEATPTADRHRAAKERQP